MHISICAIFKAFINDDIDLKDIFDDFVFSQCSKSLVIPNEIVNFIFSIDHRIHNNSFFRGHLWASNGAQI